MLTKQLILMACIAMMACNNASKNKAANVADTALSVVNFEADKWKIKDGVDYPYRDKMLSNLLATKQLKQLKRNGVIELLGPPDRVDSNYLFYRVAQQRVGFFPLHTKTLVIKLNEDSTVLWTKIHQ